MAQKRKLSDEEYIADDGVSCPYCGKPGTQNDGSFEMDGPTVWQNNSCNLCGAEWEDWYQLVFIQPRS
jgi:hypothetical protein